MDNVVVIAILLAIVSGVVWYMIRKKKRGESFTGCSCASKCGGNCDGSCFGAKQTEAEGKEK